MHETNLRLMGQEGNMVQFKIAENATFERLRLNYIEKAGLALHTLTCRDPHQQVDVCLHAEIPFWHYMTC
jgi:hypothetical protein